MVGGKETTVEIWTENEKGSQSDQSFRIFADDKLIEISAVLPESPRTFSLVRWLFKNASRCDTSATLKTEQIIHDACEVQVDIFSSFKVRLLQLEHEARRRRAGFETISLSVAFLHNKEDERMGPAATPGASRANTPVARCECYQMWHFEAKLRLHLQHVRRNSRLRTAGFCFSAGVSQPGLTAILQSAAKAQTQHVERRRDGDAHRMFILQTCISDVSKSFKNFSKFNFNCFLPSIHLPVMFILKKQPTIFTS